MIPSDVLVAVNKRLYAPLEQVQVAIPVKVAELVEVAGADFPTLESFAEPVAIPDKPMIAPRFPTA
jgi:hypothetical protein